MMDRITMTENDDGDVSIAEGSSARRVALEQLSLQTPVLLKPNYIAHN
jgi:hypothetical protein